MEFEDRLKLLSESLNSLATICETESMVKRNQIQDHEHRIKCMESMIATLITGEKNEDN